MEEVVIKAKDEYKLCVHIFETDSPKGIVQIIHGMEEHQERYEEFAGILNKSGYTVVSSDMRGHGYNAPMLGFFSEKDGYKYLLSDQKRITAYIKKRFKTDKVIIFAHSMGTIIARNLLQTQSGNYKKVILSGYPCSHGKLTLMFGLALTDFIAKTKGANYNSVLVEDLSIGSFNRTITNPKTSLDWISVNEENVSSYINDPYCGHGFKVAAFNDLFHLLNNMTETKRYRNINKNLPILALRGEKDPCTGFEKGSRASIHTLKTAGFNNIKQIKYPNMRHEILNETGKEKVFRDIVKFLELSPAK